MLMNDKISVIIPIYNVEKYLEQCIESVINQTYENLEIILVDDGSSDKSSMICDKYKLKDNRIKVLCNTNMGVGAARNSGLEISTGKYVTFIDSDDYVSPNYIYTMYKNLKETNSDMSICESKTFKGKYCKSKDKKDRIKIFNSQEIIDMMLTYNLTALTLTTPWGNLVPLEFYKVVKFPEGTIIDDQFIVYRLYMLANKISYTNKQLYYYRIRKGSIMQQKYSIKRTVIFEAYEQRLKDLIEKNYDYTSTVIRFYSSCYWIKANIKRNKLDYDTTILDNKVKELNKLKLKLTPKLFIKLILEKYIARFCFYIFSKIKL